MMYRMPELCVCIKTDRFFIKSCNVPERVESYYLIRNNLSMIKIRNIHKSYTNGQNNLHVLKGIDLDIEAGEMISIMGPSGSGKSTLLNIFGILDNYDDGEYFLDGSRILHLNERKAALLRNRMLGFVFQSFNLISFKNAMENVALPLDYQKVNRRKRNKIALEYLDKLGLKEWAHHLPSELSKGQKQRVAIARALITQPKVILADEPTGALDSVTSQEMMDLLTEINQTGITMIIVTHELDIARHTQKTIRIIDGTIQEIVKNEAGSQKPEGRSQVRSTKYVAASNVQQKKYEKVA